VYIIYRTLYQRYNNILQKKWTVKLVWRDDDDDRGGRGGGGDDDDDDGKNNNKTMVKYSYNIIFWSQADKGTIKL